MTHRWRTGGVGRDRPATCDFRPCTGGDVGRSVGCKQWAARRTPGSRECSAAARTEPSAEAGGQHAGEHVVLATCTRSDNFLAASQKQLGMLKRRQKKAATNAIAVGRETASLAEGLDVVRMAHDIPAPEPIHRGIVEGKLDGGGDLASLDMRHADLSGVNFRGATLIRAELSCAKLAHCDFGGSGLASANLNGACLIRANLVAA